MKVTRTSQKSHVAFRKLMHLLQDRLLQLNHYWLFENLSQIYIHKNRICIWIHFYFRSGSSADAATSTENDEPRERGRFVRESTPNAATNGANIWDRLVNEPDLDDDNFGSARFMLQSSFLSDFFELLIFLFEK